MSIPMAIFRVNYAGGWLLAPFIYGEEDGAGIW